MTKQLNLRLDEDLIKEFEDLAKDENLDRSSLIKKILIEGLQKERFNIAIKKYVLKEISIEKAAEIAKISLHEFVSEMYRLGIPSNISLEDYKKIM